MTAARCVPRCRRAGALAALALTVVFGAGLAAGPPPGDARAALGAPATPPGLDDAPHGFDDAPQSFGDAPHAYIAPDLARRVAAAPSLWQQVLVVVETNATESTNATDDPAARNARRDATGPAATDSEAHAAIAADVDAWLAAGRAEFAAAAGPARVALAAAERRGEARAVVPLWSADVIHAEVRAAALPGLAAAPRVRAIVAAQDIRLDAAERASAADVDPTSTAAAPAGPIAEHIEWNLGRIRAPEVWTRLGIDGTGVTVAVIDSGVDYHHPLLQSRYRGYLASSPVPSNAGNWWCQLNDLLCSPRPLFPVDGVGHGTHVTGIATAGDGYGVAPGARWIAVRACAETRCNALPVLQGLEWLLELGDQRPDVLNASLTIHPDEAIAFVGIIERLLAAGVVVVASTGNGGPLGAPAMFRGVIGVGATTGADVRWPSSTFDRTQWGWWKPDVMAPGAGVTSTVPGGGFGRLTGTSMAAPHVAGVAALMRQARPGLAPAEVRDVLTRTARPLGPEPRADNSGYGQIDAYAAVLAVSDAGRITGRVVREVDGVAIPYAVVRVTEIDGDPVTRSDVDADGRFAIDLRPGSYAVFIDAFGFASRAWRPVEIGVDGTHDLGDVGLALELPRGQLVGRVTDAVSGAPISGTLELVGVPFSVPVDELGFFAVQLPARTYRVRLAIFGHRVLVDEAVKVVAGARVERNYALQPAARILLVDGDAWAFTNALGYHRRSLDALGYLYHVHEVTREAIGAGAPGGPPDAALLGRYDVVIWSSPTTGPAFVRGAAALSTYLEGGGRLLLTGQDAACIDGGMENAKGPCLANSRPHPYLKDKLHVRAVADAALSRAVNGVDGSPLAGVALTLNGGDSLDNQFTPDVLGILDDLTTEAVLRYGDGGVAGALVHRCSPWRALILGFGFEGVRDAATRNALMERMIDVLVSPPPQDGLHVTADVTERVQSPGGTATFTVTLANTGLVTRVFDLTIDLAAPGEPVPWPAEVRTAGLNEPLSQTLALPSCRATAFAVQIHVPVDTERGGRGGTALRIRAVGGPAEFRLPLTARTPAPVLLIDGDFDRQSEGRYQDALDALGVSYDRWELGFLKPRPTLPTSATLAAYPAVILFAGHDFRPKGNLPPEGQALLADYLEGGGRLMFVSEDYLYARGSEPYRAGLYFHQRYLGVQTWADNAGGAYQGPFVGQPPSTLGGIGPCELFYQEARSDGSDALVPAPGAVPALRSATAEVIATQLANRGFKTLFLAFDFGQLQPGSCPAQVIGAALDWFHPLSPSAVKVLDADGRPSARRTFGGGEVMPFELSLQNEGPRALEAVDVRWTFPSGADVVSDALPFGWRLEPDGRTVVWTGRVAPDAAVRAKVSARLADGLDAGAVLSTTVLLRAEGLTLTRRLPWRVNAADLSGSAKSVEDPNRLYAFDDTIGFYINLTNSGTRDAARFSVTDTLPSGLRLVEGSWRTVGGAVGGTVTGDVANGRLLWQGALPVDGVATLRYRARVLSRVGGPLRNRAVVTADDGTRELTATAWGRPYVLFPVVLRQRNVDP
jgi:uncharacterized repeat protein (TIGR01451 family)